MHQHFDERGAGGGARGWKVAAEAIQQKACDAHVSYARFIAIRGDAHHTVDDPLPFVLFSVRKVCPVGR